MRVAPLVRALLHGGGRDGRHLRLERQVQLRHERPPACIVIDGGQVNRRNISSEVNFHGRWSRNRTSTAVSVGESRTIEYRYLIFARDTLHL